MKDKMQLYKGTSLDTFLKIRSILDQNHINYDTENKLAGGLARTASLFMVFGRPSAGMPEDHRQDYIIYVAEADYEKAKQTLGYIQ